MGGRRWRSRSVPPASSPRVMKAWRGSWGLSGSAVPIARPSRRVTRATPWRVSCCAVRTFTFLPSTTLSTDVVKSQSSSSTPPRSSSSRSSAWLVAGDTASTVRGARRSAHRWCRRFGMSTGRVVAAVLSESRPCLRLAGAAGSIIRVEGCRTTGAAARGRGPASNEPETSAGLGRPCAARRVVWALASARPGPSAGHYGHDSALASPAGSEEVDLSSPDRTPTNRRRDRRSDRPAGPTKCPLCKPLAAR